MGDAEERCQTMVSSPLEFIAYWISSLLVFFLTFYIPGRVVLGKYVKTNPLESLVLSVFLGMSLWGIQGYVFGYLNLRFLTYAYLTINWFIWIKFLANEKSKIKESFKLVIQDKWLVIILTIGIPISIVSVFTSGLPGNDGVGFYGINPIDGSFHIALINSLVRQIPPEEPGMAGVLVSNYHYWSNLILAEIIRVYKLPVTNLFYQYFPSFLALFYGLAAYLFGKLITNDKNTGRFFVFFVLFAGNLGYLVMFLLSGDINFSLASLDNGVLLFTNPPRVLAQAVFLAGTIAVIKWLKTEKMSWGVISALMMGITVGIKVYVGIFASLGMGILFFYFVYQKKLKMIVPIMLSALLSILIFFPTNKNAGGLFWAPFSWPKHFFAQGEASLLMWHLQMDEFKVHNNTLRIALLTTQMTITFLVITLGTRVLGVFGLIYSLRKINKLLLVFLVIPSITFVFIGLMFLQESGIFESFNFIAVASLIASFFTAVFLGGLMNKYISNKRKLFRWVYLGIVLVIVSLTFPRTLFDARRFYNLYDLKSGYILSWMDVSFFENMKYEIDRELVITDPTDSLGQYSPYVAAFTGKRMYFSGEGVLKAHGLDVSERGTNVKDLFTETNPKAFVERIGDLGVKYIYLRKPASDTFKNDEYFKVVIEDENNLLLTI